ncbi:MAG: DUF2073 domain-containing protein [Candidatus Woesearchaeota archaeon]|jgi:hypothetical protein
MKKEGLILQFIPYMEIENLDSNKRVDKLLKIVKDNKIVLIGGKLRPTEEAMLIQKTMEQISKDFSGVEIATVHPKSENDVWYKKLKKVVVDLLLKDQTGLTIIGPANIVKEIKKNPDNIQLLMKEE